MNLRLDENDQERLEALAKSQGVPVEEAAKRILHMGLTLSEVGEEPLDESATARKQRDALHRLHQRLDALPLVTNPDGLCVSRDHDQVLYGKRV